MDEVGRSRLIAFQFNTCAVVFIPQVLSTGLGHFDALTLLHKNSCTFGLDGPILMK
jgi:hypothetical protein